MGIQKLMTLITEKAPKAVKTIQMEIRIIIFKSFPHALLVLKTELVFASRSGHIYSFLKGKQFLPTILEK